MTGSLPPRKLAILLVTVQFFNVPAALGAQQDQGAVTAAIRQAVAATAPADASITLGSVQGAQYMQACTGGVAVAITGIAPYEQAAVHCKTPDWTLYVTVTVAATEPIVVAARPIAAGQTLQGADLTVRNEPISLYAGRQVFYDLTQLTGATAVMTLPAGTILTTSNIAEPVLVNTGQMVSVNVQSGGVDVSINAVADQAGRVGDTILLTNPASGKRFPALVTRSGLLVQLQP